MIRSIRRVRGVALLLALTPCLLPAQQAQQREHVVRTGDTLWELARIYLNNPFLWPLIFEANRPVVENPHRIFPTERLLIPLLPGEARPERGEVETTAGPGRTRFYTPPDTTTYPTLISAEPPALRRVEPRDFHASPWLADTATLNVVGHVFRSADPRTERDKLPHSFHPFNAVYLTPGAGPRPKVGDLLLAVSIGRSFGPHGRIIEPTGVIRVDSIKANTMIGMVTHQFGRLQTGDRVVPMDSFPNVLGTPVPVTAGPEGEIIGFALEQPLVGVADRAFVTLGPASVRVGDELAAYLPDRRPDRGREDRLPERPIARLLVTRLGPTGATARVVHLEEAALRPGLKVRVIRRMP